MDSLDQVREIWAEVLDVPEVGADVNFFEAGGDSILLIILLERLNALTDRELAPPDLFQHSTIRAQADLLAGNRDIPAATPSGDRTALLGRARRGN
jgi:hypothetical protein